MASRDLPGVMTDALAHCTTCTTQRRRALRGEKRMQVDYLVVMHCGCRPLLHDCCTTHAAVMQRVQHLARKRRESVCRDGQGGGEHQTGLAKVPKEDFTLRSLVISHYR